MSAPFFNGKYVAAVFFKIRSLDKDTSSPFSSQSDRLLRGYRCFCVFIPFNSTTFFTQPQTELIHRCIEFGEIISFKRDSSLSKVATPTLNVLVSHHGRQSHFLLFNSSIVLKKIVLIHKSSFFSNKFRSYEPLPL